MILSPGTRLGPYAIVGPLGAGGMGEVYRARDTRLGRDVAIKVLSSHLSANVEAHARFEAEARTISSLNHPHICTLHDVGREDSTNYLVMELVEGETLAARIARGALPIPDVLRIGIQIADALDRAHRAGIVHRDLKPGNVMLTKSGAKLMDFGLARVTGITGPAGVGSGTGEPMRESPTLGTPLTAHGTIVGTPQYLAPEQLEGREADARSDLWAVGCVLYEMATGRRAFVGASPASLVAAIIEREPPPLDGPAALAPPGFERALRKCLAKDPDERWQSASDLRSELRWIRRRSAAGDPGGHPRRLALSGREPRPGAGIRGEVLPLPDRGRSAAARAGARRGGRHRSLERRRTLGTDLSPRRDSLPPRARLSRHGATEALQGARTRRPRGTPVLAGSLRHR